MESFVWAYHNYTQTSGFGLLAVDVLIPGCPIIAMQL